MDWDDYDDEPDEDAAFIQEKTNEKEGWFSDESYSQIDDEPDDEYSDYGMGVE